MFILLVAGEPNVRFRSKADLALAPTHGRYVPKADFDYREMTLAARSPAIRGGRIRRPMLVAKPCGGS